MVIFSQGEEDLLVTVSYGALLASYRIHWASLVSDADFPVLLQLATKPQLSLTPLQSTRYAYLHRNFCRCNFYDHQISRLAQPLTTNSK